MNKEYALNHSFCMFSFLLSYICYFPEAVVWVRWKELEQAHAVSLLSDLSNVRVALAACQQETLFAEFAHVYGKLYGVWQALHIQRLPASGNMVRMPIFIPDSMWC